MRKFLAIIRPDPNGRLLDVGGYPVFWDNAPQLSDITILNIHPIEGQFDKRFHLVVGDGLKLQYGDAEFDLVHSNSVIEHVGGVAEQELFARELRRVGKKLWVQTPARHFLVEPHLMDFICHWFPRKMQRRMVRYFSIWGLLNRPTPAQAEEFLNGIRLLNRKEMERLFPDCRIVTERVLGWPKAYIAVRGD